MIKGLSHQEDLSVLNVYKPYSKLQKKFKKTLTKLKRKLKKFIITLGDF